MVQWGTEVGECFIGKETQLTEIVEILVGQTTLGEWVSSPDRMWTEVQWAGDWATIGTIELDAGKATLTGTLVEI